MIFLGENVYWLYGRIIVELQEVSAYKHLSKAVDLKPDDIGYRADYLLYYIVHNKFKEGLKYYNKVNKELILKNNNNISNKVSISDDIDDIKNDDILIELQQNYHDDFSYVYLLSVYGYLLSKMGKIKEANSIFEFLVSKNNNDFYELHYYYGMHLEYSCNKHNHALKQFIKALIIEDNWAITYYHISIVLFKLKDYHSSMSFLNKSFKMNPSIPIIYKNFYQQMSNIQESFNNNGIPQNEEEDQIHRRAVTEYRRRNWPNACILFLRLLQINHNNTNYQHNLAMVLYYGFENDEASEKYFRQSLRSCGSSHPDIIRHYCVLLIKQKRWEEAHAYYDILFRVIEQYNNARNQQIKDENNRWDKAVEQQFIKYKKQYKINNKIDEENLLNKIKEQIPKRTINENPSMKIIVDDHSSYALICQEGFRQYDVAKEHLKKAIKIKPNDGTLISKYAIVLQNENNYKESSKYFKNAIDKIPNNVDVRYQYASLLWWMQKYKEACHELSCCLKIIKDLNKNSKLKEKKRKKNLENEEKCSILYGIILIELERYNDAQIHIKRSIEISEDINGKVDSRYIAEYMLLLIKEQKYNEAFECYELALQTLKNKNDWYLKCIYALYLSKIDDLPNASRIFEELIESDDNKYSPCYSIHYYYGLHLHYGCKLYEKAKEQYILAMTIEDNWAITYFHLAQLLYKLKEYGPAKTFVIKAFQGNKDMPEIKKNYRKLLNNIADKMDDESSDSDDDSDDDDDDSDDDNKNNNIAGSVIAGQPPRIAIRNDNSIKHPNDSRGAGDLTPEFNSNYQKSPSKSKSHEHPPPTHANSPLVYGKKHRKNKHKSNKKKTLKNDDSNSLPPPPPNFNDVPPPPPPTANYSNTHQSMTNDNNDNNNNGYNNEYNNNNEYQNEYNNGYNNQYNNGYDNNGYDNNNQYNNDAGYSNGNQGKYNFDNGDDEFEIRYDDDDVVVDEGDINDINNEQERIIEEQNKRKDKRHKSSRKKDKKRKKSKHDDDYDSRYNEYDHERRRSSKQKKKKRVFVDKNKKKQHRSANSFYDGHDFDKYGQKIKKQNKNERKRRHSDEPSQSYSQSHSQSGIVREFVEQNNHNNNHKSLSQQNNINNNSKYYTHPNMHINGVNNNPYYDKSNHISSYNTQKSKSKKNKRKKHRSKQYNDESNYSSKKKSKKHRSNHSNNIDPNQYQQTQYLSHNHFNNSQSNNTITASYHSIDQRFYDEQNLSPTGSNSH